MNDLPRRRKLYCLVPAEKALYESVVEIEKLPAHPKLSEAQNLIIKASEIVSDFIDGKLTN
jgi:hypothetical protein